MSIELAPLLDTPAAAPLRLALREAVALGEPLLIDGSAVERIGQACLQVLAAGQAAALATGRDFRITGPSTQLAEMATLAGLADLLS